MAVTRLLLMNTGADTAGVAWRTQQALQRHGPRGWQVRQVAAAGKRGRYLDYPQDRTYRDRAEGGGWYRWADVVHLANTLHAWDWWDGGQLGRRLVLHHHGTEYRDYHEDIAAKARAIGAVQVVATVDLLGLEPDVDTWLPTPYRASELARYRQPRGDSSIVVAHAPTDRAIKGTEAVVAAVDALAAEGLPVSLDLIEGVPNTECLRRKGRADIVVDQLVLGYGVNAVEAWGMGLPVVAGVADARVRERMLGLWGQLPFVPASPDTLRDVLRQLVWDRQARVDAAAVGAAHFARWHSEEAVVPVLLDVYAATRPTRGLVLREVG